MSEIVDLKEKNRIYLLNNLDNYIVDSRGGFFNVDEQMLEKDYFYVAKSDLTSEGYQEVQKKLFEKIIAEKNWWEISKSRSASVYRKRESNKIIHSIGFTPEQNKLLEKELNRETTKKEKPPLYSIFKRVKLPYEINHLEPYISRDAMDNHYHLLHRVYEENLNQILINIPGVEKKFPDLKDIMNNLEEFPLEIREKVRYNGGGLINHNFFFSLLTNLRKDHEKAKVGFQLLQDIYRDFGTLEIMKKKLIEKALEFTGTASYWTWIVINKEKKMEIINTLNQDNPWMLGLDPLLGIDLFEHAYILDYRSNKKRYLEALINNCLNWEFISELYLQKILK